MHTEKTPTELRASAARTQHATARLRTATAARVAAGPVCVSPAARPAARGRARAAGAGGSAPQKRRKNRAV